MIKDLERWHSGLKGLTALTKDLSLIPTSEMAQGGGNILPEKSVFF